MKKITFIVAICFSLAGFASEKAKLELKLNSEKLLPSSSVLSTNKTTEGEKKYAHVIKLNASQLALKAIALQYEFAFHKNMSVALGYSALLKRTLPKQLAPPESSTPEGFKLPYLKGFSITPEFRFYPGKKEEKQAPHGFYLAPYLRYSKYTLGADYYARDLSDSTKINKYELSGSYKGTTVGLMLGSQWIVGKHFSFDWWILGAGVGKAKLVLEGSSDDITLNQAQQDALENDITTNIGNLGRFSNGPLTVEADDHSVKATVSGLPMTSLRGMVVCGFNFGYKF